MAQVSDSQVEVRAGYGAVLSLAAYRRELQYYSVCCVQHHITCRSQVAFSELAIAYARLDDERFDAPRA